MIQKRIQEAMKQAQEFEARAKAAIEKLESDSFAQYGCKEVAAAKRASMDLSRSLAELRKGNV